MEKAVLELNTDTVTSTLTQLQPVKAYILSCDLGRVSSPASPFYLERIDRSDGWIFLKPDE